MENLGSLEPQAKISHSYKKKECTEFLNSEISNSEHSNSKFSNFKFFNSEFSNSEFSNFDFQIPNFRIPNLKIANFQIPKFQISISRVCRCSSQVYLALSFLLIDELPSTFNTLLACYMWRMKLLPISWAIISPSSVGWLCFDSSANLLKTYLISRSNSITET